MFLVRVNESSACTMKLRGLSRTRTTSSERSVVGCRAMPQGAGVCFGDFKRWLWRTRCLHGVKLPQDYQSRRCESHQLHNQMPRCQGAKVAPKSQETPQRHLTSPETPRPGARFRLGMFFRESPELKPSTIGAIRASGDHPRHSLHIICTPQCNVSLVLNPFPHFYLSSTTSFGPSPPSSQCHGAAMRG